MKNGLIVEKILSLSLLLISGGVAYVVMTKGKIASSDNALLIILSVFWMILEYRIVKKIALKSFLFSKRIFRFSGKGKLHQV